MAGALLLVTAAGILAVRLLAPRAERSSLDGAQARPALGVRLEVMRRGSLGRILTPRLGTKLAARHVRLRDLRGQPTIINLWASWCPACRQEAPLLRRAWSDGRRRGMLVVGVDTIDARSDAAAFIARYRVSYPVLRDPDGRVGARLRISGLPATFFLRPSGELAFRVIGTLSPASLKQGIAAATG